MMRILLLNETNVFLYGEVVLIGGLIILLLIALVVSINKITPNSPTRHIAFKKESVENTLQYRNDWWHHFRQQCYLNFLSGITPSNSEQLEQPGRLQLVAIANYLISLSHPEELIEHLSEEVYYVNLWAAHLFLELSPAKYLVQQQCLAVIASYATNPKHSKIAQEEAIWLESYLRGE